MASKLTAPGSSELKDFYGARTSWRSRGQEHMRFRKAAALAGVRSGAAVLDIGCRDGGLRHFLPSDVRYQGMDIAEEFANEHVLIQDIALGAPFADESFDYVFCIEVLEHVHEPWRALGEMRRVLRPGGVAVLSVPNPYHVKEIIWNVFRIADRQGHIHSWTRQTMTAFGEMAGFRLDATGGTYLHPPIPSTALLARSVVYRFVKS
ncbi:MAG TPA: methyltransferase domain-containing protein [Gemmatimonadaceae bacterium]|nr:methyltransferase domain-containing protein [Gemmatimonadaceae bacterium]